MTTRKGAKAGPSFEWVEGLKAREVLDTEIIRLKPEVEVTIEGISHLAVGRILEWNRSRGSFTVQWTQTLSPEFLKKTASEAGLRNYFKCKLFSTQLIFRTHVVRRSNDSEYQYLMPDQIFKQQRRGALRVPTTKRNLFLQSTEGKFPVLDMSVGGAKIAVNGSALSGVSHLTQCSLILDHGEAITSPTFSAQLTFAGPDSRGYRFAGLDDEIKVKIKQYLIDALRAYFEEEILRSKI